MEKIEAELVDLFFAFVNLARFMKIKPYVALNNTINKFIYRFNYIEENSSKDLKDMTLEEMDELWQQSKIPNGIW